MEKLEIIKSLDELLGDSEKALTPENFSKYRLFIEEQIFPSVTWLGLDVDSIYEDYQLELIQSSGGSNKPSTGRLRYIKGHLTTLLKRVKEYNS